MPNNKKFTNAEKQIFFGDYPLVSEPLAVKTAVKAGDVIEIKEKNKGSQRYKDILEVTGGRMVPDWLEADAENLKGTVKELPLREAIDVPVDEMLIVELYSK